MLLSKFLKKETSRRLQCQDSRFSLGLPDLSGYTRTERKGFPQVFIFGGGENDASKHITFSSRKFRFISWISPFRKAFGKVKYVSANTNVGYV